MKALATIYLSVFIAFLVTPTIVAAIERDVDIANYFHLNDEEHTNSSVCSAKSISEIQPNLISDEDLSILFFDQEDVELHDIYVINLSMIYAELPSPPPELT